MNHTQRSPKRRQEKQLSARRKHRSRNHMRMTGRPRPDAPSLTKTIIVQMVYSNWGGKIHNCLHVYATVFSWAQVTEAVSFQICPAVGRPQNISTTTYNGSIASRKLTELAFFRVTALYVVGRLCLTARLRVLFFFCGEYIVRRKTFANWEVSHKAFKEYNTGFFCWLKLPL